MERYRDREAAQIGGILGLLYITEHVGGVGVEWYWYCT